MWSGLLLVAAGVLAFASEGGAFAIVSFILLLLGLGWIGVTLLRMPDDRWEAGASAVAAGPAEPLGTAPGDR